MTIKTITAFFTLAILTCPSVYAQVTPPGIEPPPLPNPVKGSVVYVGGKVLRNQSLVNAEDVRIGFCIPSGFFENILQFSLAFGVPGSAVNKTSQVVGQASGRCFNLKDFFLMKEDGTVYQVPPGGFLTISALVDSRKTNGLEWLETITLTDERGEAIKTQIGAGSFIVQPKAPAALSLVSDVFVPNLTYTFTNDGNVDFLVDTINLGWSPEIVNIENFSLGSLNNVTPFNLGQTLLPGDSITLDVPFDFPTGAFLVADVNGTVDPGEEDAYDSEILQQHQSVGVPESSSNISLLFLGILGGCLITKRKQLL